MTISILLAFQKHLSQLENKKNKLLNDLSRGAKLSKVNEALKGSIDIAAFLGKLQQRGWIRIVFDSKVDEEPLVQLTEKGKHLVIGLLFSPSKAFS